MLSSCSNENTVLIETEESQKYSFSEFIGGISHFPYEAPVHKREKVLSGFHKMKIGTNKKETIGLFSEPDAEFFSYDKTRGKTFKNSSFAYYLSRHESNLANVKYDEVLFLYFDHNEELYWAQPVNIEGLKEVGKTLHNR